MRPSRRHPTGGGGLGGRVGSLSGGLSPVSPLRCHVTRAAEGVTAATSEAGHREPWGVTAAGDPVAAGFVENLARPGGNATGFMAGEYGIAAKWLELLKEIAPSVTRAEGVTAATSEAGHREPWVDHGLAGGLPVGSRENRGIAAVGQPPNASAASPATGREARPESACPRRPWKGQGTSNSFVAAMPVRDLQFRANDLRADGHPFVVT